MKKLLFDNKGLKYFVTDYFKSDMLAKAHKSYSIKQGEYCFRTTKINPLKKFCRNTFADSNKAITFAK